MRLQCTRDIRTAREAWYCLLGVESEPTGFLGLAQRATTWASSSWAKAVGTKATGSCASARVGDELETIHGHAGCRTAHRLSRRPHVGLEDALGCRLGTGDWGLPASIKAIKTVEHGAWSMEHGAEPNGMANWRRASSCLQTHHTAAAARHGIPEAIHGLPNDTL
jgi:hypothetical protein